MTEREAMTDQCRREAKVWRWRFTPDGRRPPTQKKQQPAERRFARAKGRHSERRGSAINHYERRPRIKVPTTGGIQTTEGDEQMTLLAPDGEMDARRSQVRENEREVKEDGNNAYMRGEDKVDSSLLIVST
ncbi:hypothetical protein Scep_019708 [Stephania cephalantha]|uniref:Uncharacterized protein n=1 Tax=Stephania cephalantha TaxID=152367 RepID=A0AAP0IB64_9MAGN